MPLASLPPGVSSAGLPHVTGVFNLVAFLAILAVTAVLVIGIEESANLNSAIVIVKLFVVGMFLVLGIGFLLHHPEVAKANWHPFIPKSEGPGTFGIGGITAGAASIFFAYIGFDAVSTAAQEAKNPQRDMPIGILGSLVICTILYILVSGVLTGLVNYHVAECGGPGGGGHRCNGRALGIDPGEDWRGVRPGNGDAGDAAGAVAGVLLDVARTGCCGSGRASIHPRFRTPWISNIVVGADRGVHAGAAADR